MNERFVQELSVLEKLSLSPSPNVAPNKDVDPSFFPQISKRRRVTNVHSMATTESMNEKFGQEEETDDYYEFTAEDYYKLLATKKEDKFLKTKKLREAEVAARRSRITKAVIRVRFPDNHILEATFHPSDTIKSLIDLIDKEIAQPDKPFYLYTTPPKKLIKDFSQDFYTAGFSPGAIVYLSY
ncbi:hypothetical protein MtrunA17_Chr6g0458911 [Medicago truncatula]|uniref:Tether containing UBX domain for GLUT4-like protein n=1 Tax=Medicago truncatula TaxID=3880 RepID=A0A072UI12_MEDTR|nr:plant UBX domain-containing protein 1 [Medicago truncatula]KEH25430.1 tether containing UBX domain for GLUT4-like protein [Medicago truncatula]RHN50572.1 hypothetical protein MtrunA17_Chr6g0458911 [Medicago truncatula]